MRGSDPLLERLYYSLIALILLGLVPALAIRLVFKGGLSEYGIGIGMGLRTARSFLVLAPIMAAAAYWASSDPAVAAAYALKGHATALPVMPLMALSRLFYCCGWEFIFRGLVQKAGADVAGPAGGILIQTVASSLAHLPDPPFELLGAALGGLLWGIVRVRTRSILSGVLQHTVLGLALDWFLKK